jgi:hypothetical protein
MTEVELRLVARWRSFVAERLLRLFANLLSRHVTPSGYAVKDVVDRGSCTLQIATFSFKLVLVLSTR